LPPVEITEITPPEKRQFWTPRFTEGNPNFGHAFQIWLISELWQNSVKSVTYKGDIPEKAERTRVKHRPNSLVACHAYVYWAKRSSLQF